MIFLSDFLRAEIVDNKQRHVGRVGDLVVRMTDPFPVVEGVLLRGREKRLIPWSRVRSFEAREVVLRIAREDISTEPAEDDRVWLARDVLDKQIVDTDGRRVVRVNDLQLSSVHGRMLVVGVDIGGRGLLRRLGLEDLGKFVAHVARRDWAQKLIAWDVVDTVETNLEAVKLRISHQKLAKMHPADIAEVADRLSAKQRDAIFASLDDDIAADTLQEMDADDQVDILERLDPERAADILEEMDPDEAADLLADLPEERAAAHLKRMEQDEAEDVEELLAYEEDTAGGLMTTEYVTLTSDLTAAQAIDRLRELEPEAESIYYIYVVEADETLVAVLSLRDLIVAKPGVPIGDIMIRHVITVPLDASHDEVAEVMRKYNLLAVPVVGENNHLEGIVTVDDVMDTVLVGAGRRGLARIFG
ncbi:MAG TPA: CBS domain-containing protein [Candidatus Dormibacteraeota bacterium]|jgi:CBS domain-containing protein/sporulation protein YlmC with PRC-barrel domain